MSMTIASQVPPPTLHRKRSFIKRSLYKIGKHLFTTADSYATESSSADAPSRVSWMCSRQSISVEASRQAGASCAFENLDIGDFTSSSRYEAEPMGPQLGPYAISAPTSVSVMGGHYAAGNYGEEVYSDEAYEEGDVTRVTDAGTNLQPVETYHSSCFAERPVISPLSVGHTPAGELTDGAFGPISTITNYEIRDSAFMDMAQASPSSYVHENRSPGVSSLMSPYTPVSAGSPFKAGVRKQSQHDIAGGDAVFSVALDTVMAKMVIALADTQSTYLFRDFAGHFTTMLDRFGPGGYDFHRAPAGVTWVFSMIIPWLYIDETASINQISVYDEVSDWICNICEYIGEGNEDNAVSEEIWDSCAEHMASKNPHISDTAYRTAKCITMVRRLDQALVYRVLLLRNVTVNYEAPDMAHIRNQHVKLMRTLLDRMQGKLDESDPGETSELLMTINLELEKLSFIEREPLVIEEIRGALDRATAVYQSLEQHGNMPRTPDSCATIHSTASLLRRSINMSHWTLTSPKPASAPVTPEDADDSLNGERRKPTRWRRIRAKVNRFFHKNHGVALDYEYQAAPESDLKKGGAFDARSQFSCQTERAGSYAESMWGGAEQCYQTI